MDELELCPICQRASKPVSLGDRDAQGFDCQACGIYGVSRSAMHSWFSNPDRLTPLQRAALSHQVRVDERASGTPMLTTYWIERFVADARLPTPALQAANLIRVIGDHQSKTGLGYFVNGVCDAPLIGSFSEPMFAQLLTDLIDRKLLVRMGTDTQPNASGHGVIQGSLFGLSLEGWERYEVERAGKISGRYGFLAMKFGDPDLDSFIECAVKPPVTEALGYSVVDLRDVARAGVIDNILREQIRDAAFVLVDLTHDNPGAYWEAGYAEGLGKPVIYLCERAKFDTAETHFDTNHCTTLLWSTGGEERFSRELVATLRRSLNLFEKQEFSA